jgi:hypothetical protein
MRIQLGLPKDWGKRLVIRHCTANRRGIGFVSVNSFLDTFGHKIMLP